MVLGLTKFFKTLTEKFKAAIALFRLQRIYEKKFIQIDEIFTEMNMFLDFNLKSELK